MTKETKALCVLGSTGSIGSQTLDVVSKLDGAYTIKYLTAGGNFELLDRQARLFNPEAVVIQNEDSYKKFKEISSYEGKILCGRDDLIAAAGDPENDLVMSALVGFGGVEPTLAAIRAGTDVALANKETLVAAGGIVTSEARKYGSELIAVDSEHSAVLQCLVGENREALEKIILTASGGPFRDLPLDEFEKITVSRALKHPNWSMGAKITIDSGTMMNKGFEVIEAKWLFDVEPEQIQVLIHPQSAIHSMAQFADGSIKAQIGAPDMRTPIAYALTYPNREPFDFPRLDFSEVSRFDFYAPDYERYPCLKIALESATVGGAAPAAVNAANESAVAAFLNEKIRFVDIAKLVEKALNKFSDSGDETDLDLIIETDKEARKYVEQLIEKKSR